MGNRLLKDDEFLAYFNYLDENESDASLACSSTDKRDIEVKSLPQKKKRSSEIEERGTAESKSPEEKSTPESPSLEEQNIAKNVIFDDCVPVTFDFDFVLESMHQ